MTTAPTLNRFARIDKPTGFDGGDWIRWMNLDDEKSTEIERAFAEIIADQVTIAAVQTALDGKNSIFRATSAPTATATGDLWLDSDDGDKPYRWSGSAWVAVQDIGAAYARLGLNSDGTVGADKVLTSSVVAGAILTTPGSTISGSTTLSSGSYTWTDCGSWTLTMSGNPVIVRIAFDTEIIDNCKLMYRVQCDGVTLGRQRGPIPINSTDDPGGTITRRHTPTAGSRTYKLQCAVNDAGDAVIHDPVLDITENNNL